MHFVMRLAPLFVLSVLFSEELICGDSVGRDFRICCDLLSAAVLSDFYPCSHEKTSVSLACICAAALYYVSAGFFCGGIKGCILLMVVPSLLFNVSYRSLRILDKYRELSMLLRRDGALCRLEEDSHLLYSGFIPVIILLLLLLASLGAPSVLDLPLAIAEIFLYSITHRRAYSGRSMLLKLRRERRLFNMVNAEMNSAIDVGEIEEDILAGIYRRVQTYMQLHRPFLNESFTLENMCSALNMNKHYISRAINKYAKKNFRQYVNYYRVKYSIEKMKREPDIKIIELAFGSGFHSAVTYNMAFKLFMGITPSDMLARIRLSSDRQGFSTRKESAAANPARISLQDAQG